jgi:hypothetical protein
VAEVENCAACHRRLAWELRLHGESFVDLRGRCFNCFATSHLTAVCCHSTCCFRCFEPEYRLSTCPHRLAVLKERSGHPRVSVRRLAWRSAPSATKLVQPAGAGESGDRPLSASRRSKRRHHRLSRKAAVGALLNGSRMRPSRQHPLLLLRGRFLAILSKCQWPCSASSTALTPWGGRRWS